jgi:hypothetical protein
MTIGCVIANAFCGQPSAIANRMSTALKPFELTITIEKISGLLIPQARIVKVEWVDDKVGKQRMMSGT